MRTPPRIRPLAQSRRSPFGGGRVPSYASGGHQYAVSLFGLSENAAFLFPLHVVAYARRHSAMGTRP
jgi:hypothetical protein